MIYRVCGHVEESSTVKGDVTERNHSTLSVSIKDTCRSRRYLSSG
jgi:hypothetical protein